MVRRYCFIFGLLVFGLLAGLARAENYKLANGDVVVGELLAGSANDQGVQIKVDEGKYERVPWANFSQEDLKKFAKTPKLQPLVEPFIEITQEEKIKKTEVAIKQPVRLERPAPQTLFGGLFSSSVGLFLLLVLYAGNIYAAYEVAIFRAQPPLLVCGLAAIPALGFASPIVFLSLPTKLTPSSEMLEGPPQPSAEASATEAVNPMQAAGAEHPTGLKLAGADSGGGLKIAHVETEPEAPEAPTTTTFQRGQFTFNRRFFETKFVGFFGVVRRDADRDMVLVIKAARGQYVGQRITRIAANDLHLQVQHGHTSEEVMIPFQEIQEIRLQHKSAKV